MKESGKKYPYEGVYDNLPDLIGWFRTHYENMIQPRYLINQKIEGLRNTSVFIESECSDGSIKTGIGTVYDHFLNIKTTGQHTRWLITTKDTIEGASTGKFIFRDSFSKATIQVRDYYYNKGNAWINHPNDKIPLVTMPYASADTDKRKYGKATLQSIHSLLIPFEQDKKKIDNIENVIFFDHLKGLNSISYNPIIRKGITSTPFGQEQEFPPSFLIDGQITASSIGSPVLLIKRNFEDKRVLFLGIIINNLKVYEAKYTVDDINPPKLIEQYDSIGVVVNSTVIPELIKHAAAIYMNRKGENDE